MLALSVWGVFRMRMKQDMAKWGMDFKSQRFAMTRDMVPQADNPITLITGNDIFILESFLLGTEGGLLGYGALGVGLLVELLEAVTNNNFIKATAMQARVQGFCDDIYARPLGDYRARCKVALVHMGLLTPQQTFVRPPYLSLWEAEGDATRQAVLKAGLLEIINH
jgi:dihydrodipicolinate synthase/N-acetylneuraminate lyase